MASSEPLRAQVGHTAIQSYSSQDFAVRSISGALGTAIALPAYNPNTPPVLLTYDSRAADPRSILVEHHRLNDTQGIPSQANINTHGAPHVLPYHEELAGEAIAESRRGRQLDRKHEDQGRIAYRSGVGCQRLETISEPLLKL